MTSAQRDRQTALVEPPGQAAKAPIGGQFAVALDRPLEGLGGGLPAYGVTDRKGRRDDLMAVCPRGAAAPRGQALTSLSTAAIPGLGLPVAHGPGPAAGGGGALWVICRAPQGRAVGDASAIGRIWGEAELLARVLRPAAAMLAALEARRTPLRAIRPDNVFQPGRGQPVTLGQGWATPPASLQPAAFEPPYVAACLTAGRGEGAIADDVYALGVLLLALSTGAWPMAGLDAAEIVRRKLAHGSFAALTGERRIPSAIAELVRGMVAEDPEHRPSPAQLGDPETLRARRVAARPARQAQTPLVIEGRPVWTARALAGALAAAPAEAVPNLRNGTVDRWLRRNLADATLAARVDETVRARAAMSGADDAAADALLLTRAVAALDPLAPLCWRSLALWPDGLGAALAEASPVEAEALRQLVATEAIGAWAELRPQRCDVVALRMDARQQRSVLQQRGWTGGLRVLRYFLNPLGACSSARLASRPVHRLPELLPALEEAAGRPGRPAGLPLDSDSAAFIVAREDLRVDRDLTEGANPASATGAAPGEAALAQLRVLARLQQHLQAQSLPALASWLAAELRPALSAWRSRTRRAEIEGALTERAGQGRLAALLDLIDDPVLRERDEREARAAAAALARIDVTLARLEDERTRRVQSAVRVGQEVAAALGVIAASSVALWLAL